MSEVARSTTLEVRRLTGGGEEWDAFVRNHPHGTFCHLSGWQDVIGPVMRQRPIYLEARDAGEIRGVLPLFRQRNVLFGSRLVSVPFLNYGGPLGDEEAATALIRAAVGEAQSTSTDMVELRSRQAVKSDLPANERKVTVLLPLPDDPEDLWSSFKSKVRSQIRRPMKEGLEARIGADQLEPFYEVFARNMRDLGTPVLPRSLFEAMARMFPDQAVFAAVYHQGHPVAGGAGFVFGDEFEITWASSLREFNRQAPNMLLYWSLMEEMTRRGVGTFNFGRCTPGEGTHRFKLQWGGHDERLPWLTWPAGEEEDTGGPGRLSELASSGWQRLPVPVANLLGPKVARQLPWW